MFDIRTIMASDTYLFASCAFVMWLVFSLNKRRFSGLGFWAAGATIHAVATGFIVLRGLIPDLLSIVLSNAMIQTGSALYYFGYRSFAGARKSYRPALILIAVFVAEHSWFTYADPNLVARNVGFSVCMSLICAGISAVTFRTRVVPKQARLAAWVNVAYIAVNAGRIATMLAFGVGSREFMGSRNYEPLWQAAYQVLFLLEIAAMVYMVVARYSEALAENEEKFIKAFRSAPYAIVISDAETAGIEEVNEGFSSVFGFSADETLGRTAVSIGMWRHPERRGEILEALGRRGSVPWTEVEFRRKDGRSIQCNVAVQTISVKGRKMTLWVIDDITERKAVEEDVRRLLKEKEALLREVHHRVKNNFASSIGLLLIQAEAERAPGSGRETLMDAARRLESTALLYERLYRTERYEALPLRDFLEPLVRDSFVTFPNSSAVTLSVDLDEVPLAPGKLLPIGMIATELVANSMKHAYLGRSAGRLWVRAARTSEGRLELAVEDDGPGFDPEDRSGQGFGFELVRGLASQLEGELRAGRAGGRFAVAVEFEA